MNSPVVRNSNRVVRKRRYFFSLTDGINCLPDANGRELCSDVDARNTALSNAENVVQGLNPTILVTDVRGRAVYATSFNEALKARLQKKSLKSEWPQREAMFVQTEMLSGVGGWELDLRQRRLDWTDGTFGVFDLAGDVAPTYRKSLKYFTASSRSVLNRAIAKTIRDGEQFDIELRITSAAGVSKWIRMVGQCEEFALILNDVETDFVAVALAESIQARLRGTNGFPWNSRVSLGIALYPNHDEEAEGLLKSADIALYSAKAAGRGALCVFSSDMRLNLLKRVAALENARSALREGHFTAFYQPLVTLTSGSVVGFEALLRWNHPDKGILLPEVLQHALDDAELATAIGVVVLDKVLTDISAWTKQGFNIGRVGINVTPLELSQAHFANHFLERVFASGVSATSLEIEVTENALVGRGSDIIEGNLRKLSTAGVTIALDDFGTGYGSLIHLRQMPIDTLKIDRAFVRDMQDEPHAKAIVRALINLARSLEMKLVAEGVETQEQAEFLLQEGSTINPALPYGQIVELLKTQTYPPASYQASRQMHALAK